MRRVAVWLMGVCTAFAQRGAPLPPANEVIERYLQVLGGRQALESIASRAGMGSLYSPTSGAWGGYAEMFQRPNRLLRGFQVERYGVVQQCFDGSRGWMETPEFGIETLEGQRLTEMRREAEFEDPLKLPAMYATITVRGRTQLEEREAFEVVARYADGVSETLFFAAGNGLLLCRESAETARDGSSRRVRVYYEDYAETGGIQVARTLRYVSDDLIRIMKRGVSHNVPLDESRFTRPSGK